MPPAIRPSLNEKWTLNLQQAQWSWCMLWAQRPDGHWKVCSNSSLENIKTNTKNLSCTPSCPGVHTRPPDLQSREHLHELLSLVHTHTKSERRPTKMRPKHTNCYKEHPILIKQFKTCKISGSAPFSKSLKDSYTIILTSYNCFNYLFNRLIAVLSFYKKRGLPWKFACLMLSH